MSSFSENLGDAVQSGICTILNSASDGGAFVKSIYGVDPSAPLQGIRNNLCDDPTPADFPPPFTGGQCPCSVYQVTFGWDGGNGFGQQGDAVLDGPIFGVTVADDDIFIDHGAPDCGGRRNTQIASGQPELALNTARILTATAVFGTPDDCGDPPPDVPDYPPEGVDVNISFTYVDNSSNNVNISGVLTVFAPVFAPVGVFAPRIFAPVRISLPDFVYDGTVQISPTFDFTYAPSGDDSPGDLPPPTEPEDPSSSPPTADDDSDRILLGVVVRSRQTGGSRATELEGGNAPDLFVPRLGSVYFRTRSRSALAWVGPFDLKTTSAYVPVPANTYAIASAVAYEPGWGGEKRDVYGSPPRG